MKELINTLEFKSDDSWEEVVRYYYCQGNSLNEQEFINEISNIENTSFQIDQLVNYKVTDEEDFSKFIEEAKIKIDNKKLRTHLMSDDWDYKAHLITDSQFLILRIWETSA